MTSGSASTRLSTFVVMTSDSPLFVLTERGLSGEAVGANTACSSHEHEHEPKSGLSFVMPQQPMGASAAMKPISPVLVPRTSRPRVQYSWCSLSCTVVSESAGPTRTVCSFVSQQQHVQAAAVLPQQPVLRAHERSAAISGVAR
jgi:hypothetical protein